MKKNGTLKLTLIGFVLIGSVLACNLPEGENDAPIEEPLVEVGQETEPVQKNQPFEQVAAEEFFQICELGGGQVKRWGDGWACDFDTGEDITCNSEGDCTFGKVSEIVTSGYTAESPVITTDDDPGNFVATCEESGGAVFEWDAGFGCDFDQTVDVFCATDGECGLGWVVELTGMAPIQGDVSNPDDNNQSFALVASMFQPAFVPDTVVGDETNDGSQDTFVMAKEVSIEFFQKGHPQTDSDSNGNVVAKEDDSDDGGGDEEDEDICDDDGAGECPGLMDAYGEICEIEGGSPIFHDEPNDPDGNNSYVTCNFDDYQDWICDKWGCYYDPNDAPRIIDFGNFQESFFSTQVYFVLAGISDIDPGFLSPNQDWNALYAKIVDQNGIVAPNNFHLPGAVSIAAPNNIFAPPIDPAVLIRSLNVGDDPLDKKECGILRPPLCWPDIGLLIPAGKLTYFVEVDDLPLPDQFKWVENFEETSGTLIADPAEEEENENISVDPVTIEEEGSCRSGPGIVYSIVSFLKAGDSATVLGRNARGNWVFVRLLDDSECWVWEGIFSESSDFSEAEVFPDPPTPIVIVTPTTTPTNVPPTVPPPPTTVPPTQTPTDPMNASISGTVFKDGNGDGSMNGGDLGYGGVTVRLGSGSCGSTGLDSVGSDSGGGFNFNGLAAGTYCVSVNITSSCGDYSAATTSTDYTINLAAGGSSDVFFGFQKVICN